MKKISISKFEEKIKFLENENQLLKNAQKLSNIGSWDYNLKTKRFIWSDETYKIFGYKVKEIKPTLNLVLSSIRSYNKEEIKVIFHEIIEKPRLSGKFSNVIICPNGETKYLNISYILVRGANKKPYRVFGSVHDITSHKKAEDILMQHQEVLEKIVKQRTRQFEKINIALKKENSERVNTERLMKFQLDEKEILLKEVHHRVKNNMQVIISLLNLQAATIDDTKIHELYRESQNRIKSMALIHEKLYQSKDLSHIDFSEYVNSLTSFLSHSYLSGGRTVEISTKTQKTPLEYDTVISLGLIINELVSNSMKYAFNGQRHGKIEISLKKEKNNLLNLRVSDNGIGFPEQIDFRDTKSLGLQLVCSLSEQIGGNISMCNKKGTQFYIQFQNKSKKHKNEK